MASRYLFHCPVCKHEIELVATQAGQHMTCSACDKEFEAPKLGSLRQLPIVGGQQADHTSFTGLKRVLFSVGLMLAVLMGIAGFTLYSYGSRLIIDVDLDGRQKDWSEVVDEMSPAELLENWDKMAVELGLGEWREQLFARYKTQGTYLQYIAIGLLVLAGIGMVMMISSFLLKVP